MKKLLHAIFIALLVFQLASAKATAYQQPANPPGTTSNSASVAGKNYKNLKIQADQLNAVISGDYATAAELTYFKLVKIFGGRAVRFTDFVSGPANPSDESLGYFQSSANADPRRHYFFVTTLRRTP
jgi:hypothetical protein